MELLDEDCKSLLAQVKHQEKELRLKRRWLIGLPVSKHEQKQVKGSKFQNDRFMPEYLLREDDVSYETIKNFVEKGAGGCNAESKYHMVEDNMQLFHSPNNVKGLFSLIGDMNSKGLCSFAEILTGGSIKFEKTRWKMKNIIKECLSEVLRKQSDTHHVNLSENLSQLLKDPHNFRFNGAACLTPDSQSYHAAVVNILDGLEDLPTQTLSAMHRKLKGIKGYMPRLRPKKSGWGRDSLIKCLRNSCMGLLSELGEGDELQEPLVKAMEVAGLTLKLIQGCHYVTEFKQFSPEINVLQNEISMSIWLLNQRMTFPVLKNLQFLLDPNAELSNRSLRTAIRNLLTEYLFECSDMDPIPECLVEILAIIKKSSEAPYKNFSKNKIEEEVECILIVSAQIKQVVWDLIPEHEFDLEFADAYIEELEESDDGDAFEDHELQVEHSQNNRFHSSNSDEEIESIGEINPANSDSRAFMAKEGGYSSVLTPNRNSNSKLESMQFTHMNLVDSNNSASLKSKGFSPPSVDGMQYHMVSKKKLGQTDSNSLEFTDNQNGSPPPFSPDRLSSRNCVRRQEPTHDSEKPPYLVSSNFSCAEQNLMFDKQGTNRNQYLSVQTACDEASMVAYRVIGHILDEFAQKEGFGPSGDDISYLRGYDPIRKNCKVRSKKPISSEEDVCCSVVIQAVEELIPSFPQSGKERLKELMGSN